MKKLLAVRLYESEVNKTRLVIPAGTELYHATGEDFDAQALHPGRYDNVLWTTREPAISQTYIPADGGITTVTSTDSILQLNSKSDEALLASLGLHYTDVTYQNGDWGGMKSAMPPKEFQELHQDPKYKDDYMGMSRRRCAIVNERLVELGYKPKENYGDAQPCYNRWKLTLDSNNGIKRGDVPNTGRLLVIVPRTDLLLFDNTYGEEIEGDLTNVEYHDTNMFRKREAEGFDGVKINDFAQSRDHGNFGHLSLGLFKGALAKCAVHEIEGVIHHDLADFHRSGNYNTPEYLAWKKQQG